LILSAALLAALVASGCNVGKTDTVAGTSTSGGSTGGGSTGGGSSKSGCTLMWVVIQCQTKQHASRCVTGHLVIAASL
jgi:hypothetical protein